MYVLVFWTEYKKTSIVEEKNLCPDAPEGEVVFVKYKDGEKYKAKIVKKSYDKDYLNRLRVNQEGELIKVKTRFTEKRAVFQKYEINRKRKAQEKSKTVSSHLAATELLNSNSIFSDTSSENEENKIEKKRKQEESEAELSTGENTNKITRTQEKTDGEQSENEIGKGQRKIIEIQAQQQELRKKESLEQQNYKKELETQRAQELERQRKRLSTEEERLREQELRKERERQREKERKKDRREQKKEQLRQLLTELEEETATESEDGEDDLDAVEAEREIEMDEQDLMENERRKVLIKNRKRREQEENEEEEVLSAHMPGNGKIQLCKLYNVWIDKADISYFQRWLESPRELTRQLLKNLVGVENLKRMCARGKSRTNTRAIPEDIMKAVEYYVNKRCTSRLKPVDFTNVVNMMIGTLRNPKKNN